MARGFPHALLQFDRAAVLSLPEVALLPYNTKAWHSKAAYVPVTDAAEKTEMLRVHAETHRYPSLEVLVHYGLDFTHLQTILFPDEEERQWVIALMAALDCNLPAALEYAGDVLPPYNRDGETRLVTHDHLAACRQSSLLLSPPLIPFD